MIHEPWREGLLNGLHSVGALGPWVVIPIYAVAVAFFVPISVLGLAAGAMFGEWTGFLVVSVSSTASAGVLFLAGRYLTRAWAYKKIEANEKARALDDAATRGGWKMVAMLRLTYILPFSLTNYVLGVSKIRFRDYILATWIAMMPACLMFAYAGALAGPLVFEGRAPKKTTLELIFFVLGFALTVGLSIYATMKIKKILK